MPTPLIELQRRLSLVGAIRAGGEKPERGVGRKLEAWRITSQHRALIEQAATLYGGDVSEWTSPIGQEWQVYTRVAELPCLLMPSYSLRQTYELWEGATKRSRLCDGVDEELSGGPCLCNAEGIDRCDLYTRLVVALPELDTLLGWRVITRGINAAHELPTMIAAAQSTSGGRQFVPARLRLEQRRGVVDGTVARFVVPTLDLGVGYAALAASGADGSVRAQLPPSDGVTPAVRREPTIEQALDAADSPALGRRRAAAFGVDVPAGDVTAPTPPDEHDTSEQTYMATDPQKAKLNVLVGTLREQEHITTDGVYDAIGTLRGTGGLDLAMTLDGYDAEHVLHWSPLREALTRSEAHQLIEWLVEKERRVSAPVTGGALPAASASTPERSDSAFQPPPDVQRQLDELTPIPFGEFPEGY
jgi:hypothetical protein